MKQRKIWLLAGVILVAAVSVPVLALASTKRTMHAVNLNTKLDAVIISTSVGAPGDVDTDAGIVNGTIAGSPDKTGAVTQVVTWGSGLTFSGHGTTYAVHGTTRFKATGKASLAGGKETLSGTLKIVGGTGLYKGATGTLTFTGTAPVGTDTDAVSAHLTGKLKY